MSGAADAQTDSDTLIVSATAIAACDIVANDHEFGEYIPISGAPLDATSTIDVTCTNGKPYSIQLDGGTTPGGRIRERLMTDGVNTLAYNLYTSAARVTVWGDGSGSSQAVSGVGSGVLQTLTVYGRIPADQAVPAAIYTDTVTATIYF